MTTAKHKYSQFIYGKLVSSQDSGYMLVAYTNDLENRIKELTDLVEKTHCFWGNEPPVRNNVKAVGIFWKNEQLILLQASNSLDVNNQLAQSGARDFIQYRYIFIPSADIKNLQGRTFLLLFWIFNQQIPLIYNFNPNLQPLEIDLVKGPISSEIKANEVNLFRQYLQADKSQIKNLLFAQDALINDCNCSRQINLDDDSKRQTFLRNILLLVPNACRHQVSIAVGTVDEKYCSWANIVIKTHSSSTNNLLTAANEFQNNYTSLIYDIINNNLENLNKLLETLDNIEDKKINLKAINDPQIIIRLLFLLPTAQQQKAREKYISNLTIKEWQTTIPLLNNDQEWLIFAWDKLSLKITEPESIDLMLQIWEKVSSEHLNKLINKLTDNCNLGKNLLEHGLLQHCQHLNQELTNRLIQCCQKIVSNIANQEVISAWGLAQKLLLENNIFTKIEDKFELLNASVPESLTSNTALLQDEKYPSLVINLILKLPEEKDKTTRIWQKYLSNLDAQKWPSILNLIINNQEALLIAWQNLSKLIDKSQASKELIHKILNSFKSEQLISALDDLQNNLNLTNILVDKDFLNLEIWTKHEPEITTKLREVCLEFVHEKSNNDCEAALKKAANLLLSSIFKNAEDKFKLIDKTLSIQIQSNHFEKVFNFHLAPLLSLVNQEIFSNSNLYSYLKHSEIISKIKGADLINDLLKYKKLSNLLLIATSTNMSYQEQDIFYESFLTNWKLQDSEIKQSGLIQKLFEKNLAFKRSNLEKTFYYFELKIPELTPILDDLEADSNDVSYWYNLAEALYKEDKERINFIDLTLGCNSSKSVIKKSLPILEKLNDDDFLDNFVSTSNAWKQINKEQLEQIIKDIYLDSQPTVLPILTRCVFKSSHSDWIAGTLLHYLTEIWIIKGEIEQKFQGVITDSCVYKYFSFEDWLKLIKLSWNTSLNLDSTIARPTLETEDKQRLINLAFETINKTIFAQKENINWDKTFNFDSDISIKTQESAKTEDSHVLIKRVLKDCKNWGMSFDEIRTIIRQCPQDKIDLDLIYQYIVEPAEIKDKENDINLIVSQIKNSSVDKVDEFLNKLLPENIKISVVIVQDIEKKHKTKLSPELSNCIEKYAFKIVSSIDIKNSTLIG